MDSLPGSAQSGVIAHVKTIMWAVVFLGSMLPGIAAWRVTSDVRDATRRVNDVIRAVRSEGREMEESWTHYDDGKPHIIRAHWPFDITQTDEWNKTQFARVKAAMVALSPPN